MSEDLEDIPAETPLSPEEAVLRRHRREKKKTYREKFLP